MATPRHSGQTFAVASVAYFYVCSSYYHRGRQVCRNATALSMSVVNAAVLDVCREVLLDPVVIDRALRKLQTRLNEPTAEQTQREALEREYRQLEAELGRLTHALAQGGDLPSVLFAIREREQRRTSVERTLADRRNPRDRLQVDVVVREIRRRLIDWQQLLSEEAGQARQMLRRLLRGRLIFTPEERGVRLTGEGDISGVFEGLLDSQAWRPQRDSARARVGP